MKAELSKNENFEVRKIWNRTEDEAEKVLPLSDITAECLKDLDLVIEVAHPDVIRDYAKIVIEHADLFVRYRLALKCIVFMMFRSVRRLHLQTRRPSTAFSNS